MRRDIAQQFTERPWYTSGSTLQVSRLTAPRVVLLGDAAHAVSAAFGQGVNSALEVLRCPFILTCCLALWHSCKQCNGSCNVANVLRDACACVPLCVMLPRAAAAIQVQSSMKASLSMLERHRSLADQPNCTLGLQAFCATLHPLLPVMQSRDISVPGRVAESLQLDL